MSTLVYTTQKDFDGPWLLDRNALLSLNKALEDISERFVKKAERNIADELKDSLRNYPEESQESLRGELRDSISSRLSLCRKVKVSLSDTKSLHDETIEKLLLNPELEDEAPVGLEVEITACYCSASLKLGAGTFGGSHLNIRTSPESDDAAREAFVILEQWVISNQSPIWLRIWKKTTPAHWIFFVATLVFLSNLSLTRDEQVGNLLDPMAKEILVDGISSDEISATLEILLRYRVEEIPQETGEKYQSWSKLVVFGGMAICIALTICPGVVIGVGRNKSKLEGWRAWTKFVGVSVPTLIGTTIVWPYIVEWVEMYVEQVVI